MFGSYFGNGYYGPGYFGPGAGAPPPAPAVGIDGSGLRFLRGRRPHPTEIAREQRMVEDYLRSLERREREVFSPAAAVAHEFTEAMASAASAEQLRTVLQAAIASIEDRERARLEFERRYWARALALILTE